VKDASLELPAFAKAGSPITKLARTKLAGKHSSGAHLSWGGR
jgi:hypothetical protein